jgi:hypothetical protein
VVKTINAMKKPKTNNYPRRTLASNGTPCEKSCKTTERAKDDLEIGRLETPPDVPQMPNHTCESCLLGSHFQPCRFPGRIPMRKGKKKKEERQKDKRK